MLRVRFVFFLLLIICPISSLQQPNPIKNMVLLIMENRSFDHMLGWMKKSVNQKINGVNGTECNHKSTTDPRSPTICFTDDSEFIDQDPGHEYKEVKHQVFGNSTIPTMSGFVEQASTISENLSRIVMKGFKPESLPVYSKLVQEFAVFDRWFSSIPGPTQPNRLFAYSATSHGAIRHKTEQLVKGYPQKTIFDSIHENNLDFRIYDHHIPGTLLLRNLRRLKYLKKFQHFSTFKEDASKGELRELSVIEPRYFDIQESPANDDHPAHDVLNGQRLVKEVYETLRKSPQWNDTLLVIIYDEHGGFYDHVPPPTNVPSPDNITGEPFSFNFDRLGVRVPTIMVSPWIKKGSVISSPLPNSQGSEFEHSSIPATVKKIFNLSSDFLTARDAWAATFEHVLDQATPRTDCPELLPEVPQRQTGTNENASLSEFQVELVHLAAALKGDHHLISFPNELTKNMTVRDAHFYIEEAMMSFFSASREAIKLGANGSTIVDMRPSLTTKPSQH